MITTNVFSSQNKIHKLFDLKGSTVGRSTEEKDKKEGVPLKDLDFKDRVFLSKVFPHSSTSRFQLDHDAVLAALSRDALFLSMNNVMDYSLLLGIHEIGEDTRVIDTSHDSPAIGVSHNCILGLTFVRATIASWVLECIRSINHILHGNHRLPRTLLFGKED